jgi:glycosyltransferase involved in cell wall biosynthesis
MIGYRYVPVGRGEGSWGYELDRALARHFDTSARRAFHADVFSSLECAEPPGRGDAGICHSLAMPGEPHLTGGLLKDGRARALREAELAWLSKFDSIFTLSAYFRGILERHDVTNVKGVLKYPTPAVRRSREIFPRVVVSQRFSPEKAPLLVLELAGRMPDVAFTFTSPVPPSGILASWLELAADNVAAECFPHRGDYYEYLGASQCGLVATLRDNFGVSGLDCLAAGRPYIAPDLFAYRELVADPECLYEPFCLHDMERAVRHALAVEGDVEPPWTREAAIDHLHRMLGD